MVQLTFVEGKYPPLQHRVRDSREVQILKEQVSRNETHGPRAASAKGLGAWGLERDWTRKGAREARAEMCTLLGRTDS